MTPLICIAGPTASGKSHLAILLAKHLGGEVVNADSRQIYSEMNIGTAKPTRTEQQSVPHHLIDCASLSKPWSAGLFARAAADAVQQIRERNRIPILVGGTGLYLKSLIQGLDDIPEIPQTVRAHWQERLQNDGCESLYVELQKCDPQTAAVLRPTDPQRILRALEVKTHTGQGLSEYWNTGGSGKLEARVFVLDWPREILHKRIAQRVTLMLEAGLKNEVEKLWQEFPQNEVLLKTIGYAEWMKHGWDQDARVAQMILQNTRQYAKRQLTWFRHQMDCTWIPMNGDQTMNSAFRQITSLLSAAS